MRGLWKRRSLVLAALCVALPTFAAPRPEAVEPLLQKQIDAARAAGPTSRTIFIGAAMDGSSTAFVGDVQLAELQLRRDAPELTVLRLGNGKARPHDWPPATATSLRQALAAAGSLLPRDSTQARTVVLLTSHGGKGVLSLARTPKDRSVADEDDLVKWLKPLGRTPTLLIISACYAGSLIPALQQPNRIIITAAAANRSSFGCDVDSSDTYFIEELFGRRFNASVPITRWFDAARVGVAAKERAMDLSPPSNPQIWVGAAMTRMAAQPLSAWLAAKPVAR